MSKYINIDKAKTIKKLIQWGSYNAHNKVTGKQASERFHDWCSIGLTPFNVAQVANGERDISDERFEALIIDANAYAQLVEIKI